MIHDVSRRAFLRLALAVPTSLAVAPTILSTPPISSAHTRSGGDRTMLTATSPIQKQQAQVLGQTMAYLEWLPTSSVPKLFVKADPGTLSPAVLELLRTWRAQTEVSVRGHHVPQEDSPSLIGYAIAEWLRGLA